ncbi:MAG TPA: acyl-CoA dehydrogenase family protein [Amycolatopsis sp.]|nr:acyl-CoA dehydrogenase family protein [Amycolatopsis sp.]
MEFGWSADQVRFRRELAELAEAEVPPDWYMSNEQGDQEHAALARRFVPMLAERGWLAPHWPADWGGRGDWWMQVILGEELWSRGEPRANQYMNINWIAPILFAAGTEEQREQHLGRILRGESSWCQGFSEPEAGTDLASLRCRADRDGDTYVVNGQKIWTSYADIADYCFLLVRTSTETDRHDGISILLVDMDTPGIEVRDIPAMGGIPDLIHEMFFDNVRVPVANRLGPEGEGWALIRKALSFERTGIPRANACGVLVDRVAEWLRARGELDDPDTVARLGQARAAVEAGKMLAYRAVDERQKDIENSAAPNISRAAAVQTERVVMEILGEIMGAEGMVHGSFADRQLIGGIASGIASGAYDVQLDLIGRTGLDLGRS